LGNEPPPKVAANVGVGVHNLLTVPGEHEEEVHVADCVALQSVGKVEEEERLNISCAVVSSKAAMTVSFWNTRMREG
jgi:hypothetical protein